MLVVSANREKWTPSAQFQATKTQTEGHASMAVRKRVRIIKKIREAAGVWKFVTLARLSGRYVWDDRPGYYFVEWWAGKKRRRQLAGQTPSEAIEAQRRKANELLGEVLAAGKEVAKAEGKTATAIPDAIAAFLEH